MSDFFFIPNHLYQLITISFGLLFMYNVQIISKHNEYFIVIKQIVFTYGMQYND